MASVADRQQSEVRNDTATSVPQGVGNTGSVHTQSLYTPGDKKNRFQLSRPLAKDPVEGPGG
jgi:hypothetical protein